MHPSCPSSNLRRLAAVSGHLARAGIHLCTPATTAAKVKFTIRLDPKFAS
jgi:hypothetical protein